MGFLDYAWSISLQKDNMKTGISIETMLNQPTLTQTSAGFDVTVPLPVVSVNEETEEKSMAFLGYNFLVDDDGKARVGRLFRACVYHLTTHTLMPQTGKKLEKPKRVSILDRFVNSFVKDI